MPEEAAPRVFMSYSHDSAEHRDRVLALADRLRADGINAVIDQYFQAPPEGWPAWCAVQIDTADFVLMICTETYLRRVMRKKEPGLGYGVLWEGRLINQYLYNAGSVSAKFVPLLLADGSDAHVPLPMKGGTIYRVETRLLPRGQRRGEAEIQHQPDDHGSGDAGLLGFELLHAMAPRHHHARHLLGCQPGKAGRRPALRDRQARPLRRADSRMSSLVG